jgi:hypothetical protein
MSPASISPEWLGEVAALDAGLFGEPRERLLGLLLEQATMTRVLRAGRRVSGFAMVLPARSGARLGPFSAVDPQAAADLLDATIAGVHTDLVVGVSAANTEAVSLYEARGFERTPSSRRMYRGERPDDRPAHLFAIADGAMG